MSIFSRRRKARPASSTPSTTSGQPSTFRYDPALYDTGTSAGSSSSSGGCSSSSSSSSDSGSSSSSCDSGGGY